MLDTDSVGTEPTASNIADTSETPTNTTAARPRRRRAASRPAGPPQDSAEGSAEAVTATAPPTEEPAAPAPRRRRPRKTATAAPDDQTAERTASQAASEVSPEVVDGPPAGADARAEPEAPAEAATPSKRRRATSAGPRRRRGSAAAAEDSIEAGQVVEPVAAAEADAVNAPIAQESVAAGDATEEAPEEAPEPTGRSRRPRVTAAPPFIAPGPLFQEPISERATAALIGGDDIVLDDETEEAAEESADEAATEDHDGAARRRRRRRGGRGRRRQGDDDGAETEEDAEPAAVAAEPQEQGLEEHEEADEQDGTSRRRRRRRRRGEDTQLSPDDPAQTVVRVREPRARTTDEVTALKGSTRIEAKRQRRREGREAGRKRPPILSEAEFLARREAVKRLMVVREMGDRTQIAVLEDGILVEHYVSRATQQSLIGNVYLGRVQNVLPAMEAAFVDIGRGRNAVLYAGEVDWDLLGEAGQPKRIESALKSGQSVLVQVTKDPVGHKGARLTSQVSLPGRYLVYVPGGSMSGISRKLPDTERSRLKNILKGVVPEDAGVIVRTAAEGATEAELTQDVERLAAQWADIQKKAQSGNAPALLYGEPDLTVKVVRDLFNEDVSELVVEGDEAWDTIESYVSFVAPHLVDRLRRHTGTADVFATYRIDEQIAKALDRKVWLPSGGSLVIDRTEAMTVVDVNTGKFTGSGGNLEETVTRNNLEAAEEVVRQLRLRDIGGIIVIDFIDMVLESNRDLVLRRLVECLGRDRTKHQVAEVTSLGLVQMTRKKIGTGLLEAFSEPCECCNGRGIVVHVEPIEPTKERASDSDKATSETGKRTRRSGRSKEPAAAPPAGPDAAELLAKVAAASGHADEPSGVGESMAVTAEPSVATDVAAEPETTTAPARAAKPRRRRATRQAGPSTADA